MSQVHNIAVTGFGEGTNDFYNRVRPSFPPEALNKIYETISSSILTGKHDWKIIEPGSGTGIFSRLLISNSPNYPRFPIGTLISVEPSKGMRDSWIKNLPLPSQEENLDKDTGKPKKVIEVVEGSFDDFSKVKQFGINNDNGNDDNKADAVIIAQAWHWCPDYEKALEEIASYLKPNSPLILIWNLESYIPEWQAKIRESYQPYDLGTPQYYKGWWKKMYETKAYKDLFEEKEDYKTRWSIGLTEDVLIDRQFSKSYLTSAHLSSSDREILETKMRNIIKSAEHEWVDKDNGIFKFQYETDVVILRRKS
ncbi:uncharacterized protein L201_000286 [Kwoniella dendrophila CBS 6074]|uniref:Methyltransferase type 11 domain-containing protein n=1 Tax=Kwoniella dendrophila CBS 6074 TaxID=1295534 RepID=A0AAX4JM02_9TREE